MIKRLSGLVKSRNQKATDRAAKGKARREKKN